MSGTISAPVLIVGATGKVGRGVVSAALAAGRPVIAVARDIARLQALRHQFGSADLAVVAGSVATDAEAARLVEALRALRRPIAAVVVAIAGKPVRARLLDTPADALAATLAADLVPHAVAARHLLPLMAAADRGGGYLIVGGPAGRCAWAGYGRHSVAAAALRMLAQALHEEAIAQSQRVQLLSVETPVRDDGALLPDTTRPTARMVGERALQLVLCDRCTDATRAVVTFGERVAAVSKARSVLRRPAMPADANAQLPDIAADDRAQTSLDDARTLLQALLPSPSYKVSPP